MPQHFSDSRLFSVANTNSELRGGFARTNQIRPMEFPFWEKSLTINRHLLIHTVFHKVFYDILIGWQENWTVGQLQFSSVTQSCLTLCDPMNHSTPGLPVHYQLLELLKLMSIKSVTPSSHLILSSPSPPAPNPSQHQSLSKWVNSSHQAAKVLEFQLQHQSFQWTPRTDLL